MLLDHAQPPTEYSMSFDSKKAANKESATLKEAVTPFVASFGFKAHDQSPPRMCSCSCFFLIINGHWVMCTAAHVMDEILQLRDNGTKLTDWHINDVFTKTEKDIVYPFDVTTREWLYVRDDALGLDYCLVYVESLAAASMTSSGVRAISREGIGDATEAEKWVITGFPAHFTKQEGHSIGQRHYVIGATPIDRPANWEAEKNAASLFGQLDAPLGEEFEAIDIGGMSGGPIFGLFRQDGEKFTVKLVAVQSGWSDRSRIITACPVEPFLNAIDRLIADQDTELGT
jgi:hypothetical protein